jgi:hypothetical protein
MMPLATVKLGKKIMDSEDMFKSLFLLQLHKNICFELSFLTFISSPVHENSYIKINKLIDYKMLSNDSHCYH